MKKSAMPNLLGLFCGKHKKKNIPVHTKTCESCKGDGGGVNGPDCKICEGSGLIVIKNEDTKNS